MYKELESHRQNCKKNTKMSFFSKSKGDLGHTDLVQHKINTGSAVPIRQSLRRLPYGRRQTEKEKILRMLDLGVIEPFIQLIFFETNVKFFLERVVSEEGISTDPDKIKTVQDWPRPKTPKQMMGLSWSLLLLQEICEKTLQSQPDHFISCVKKAQYFSGMMNVNRLLLG